MKRGYIVGAGAQGRIISEIWRAQYPAATLHFLDDDPALHGSTVLGIAVLGPADKLRTADLCYAAAILAVGDNARRLQLAAFWDQQGIPWGMAVHPSAVLMPSASIGPGTVVFPQAFVNSGARVGQHVVVNSGVIVEHDSVLEDGCSLGPGVCMGGRVHIERGAFISAGVTIAPRVSIGAGSVVGAGATVVENVPPGVLAYGIPARVIRPLGEGFNVRRLL